MKLRIILTAAAFIAGAAAAGDAFAGFTLSVTPLSDYDSYFGLADVPPKYGGNATTEKSIRLAWSATVTNGTWYINIDSQTPGDAVRQVTNGTGTYNGSSQNFDLGATAIISASTSGTADGRKAVYVLLQADTALDGGSSSKQLQDNVSPIYVYFKLDPPEGQPTVTSISAGDTNLKISMNWSTESNDDDKGGFKIGYRTRGSAGNYTWTSEIFTTEYKLTGLTNLVEYELVVVQLDMARNEGALSDPVYGTPVPVADYYTYYRQHGGDEKGGFCFVATAAYGSPSHPFVGVLREFRDDFLLTGAAGRRFVEEYYRLSPPAAEFIRQRPVLRFLSGTALLPAVAAAWLLLNPAVPLAALAVAGLLTASARSRRRKGSGGGAAKRTFTAVLFLAALAAVSLPSSDAAAESKKHVQFEIKFGPYYPMHMDEEKGISGQPYKTIFGYGLGLMTQLELDYVIWDKMGTISAGGLAGYWQARGKGMAVDPTTGIEYKSSDTTILNLVPLSAQFVYRFDWAAQKKNVPLVPYAKFGIDYYFWWVLNGVGDVPKLPTGGEGSGGKWGFHTTVGLAFLLDFIDPATANDLDLSTGINNSYLFAEFTYSKVDNFNSAGFRLGSEFCMFGLMFEI